MTDKIFQALKQAYSHLGLGDTLLNALAETLVATGVVTDDNISDIVAKQKNTLEAIQKANDKRAADAAAKAKREAEASMRNEGTETNGWSRLQQEAFEKRMQEANALYEEQQKLLQSVKEENEKFRSEQAAVKRTAFIASEAKRLGVPQWRSDEGFNITAEMQDADITEYLTKVANNVKANTLPGRNWGIPNFGDGKATKEETDALAERLLKH